jgi:hypothetical protein
MVGVCRQTEDTSLPRMAFNAKPDDELEDLE